MFFFLILWEKIQCVGQESGNLFTVMKGASHHEKVRGQAGIILLNI